MAKPPSPEKPRTPLPATGIVLPSAETFQTLELRESATKTLPDPSAASAFGAEIGPPTVVMMPAESTLRTLLLIKSAMNRLPEPSTAIA